MPRPELFSSRSGESAAESYRFVLERKARRNPSLLVDLSALAQAEQWVDAGTWLRCVAPACLDASVLSLSLRLDLARSGPEGPCWLLRVRTWDQPDGDTRPLHEWQPADERSAEPGALCSDWPVQPDALLWTLLERMESWPWASTLGLCSPSHLARLEEEDSLASHCDDLQAELDHANGVVEGLAQWLAAACERDGPALREGWLNRLSAYWKVLDSPDDSEPNARAFLGLLSDMGGDHGLYEFGASQLRQDLHTALAQMPALQRVLLVGYELGCARELESHLREASLDRDDLSLFKSDAVDDLLREAARELTYRAGRDHVTD